MSLATIAMFWDGPPFSLIERLCISSFLSVGHPVVLYSYEPIEGVPEGVELRPATDILPRPDQILRHERTGSAGIHSDKFRYHLLAKWPGVIWADTDAYCLAPFIPKDGYFFGREGDEVVASGVVAMPAGSPTLQGLIEFFEDEYAIPPWMMPKHKREMRARAEAGDPMHVSEMPWGAWGPKALSHFLRSSGEFDRSLAPHVLYPIPFKDRRVYFRQAWKAWKMVEDDTVSIHFYGCRVRAGLATRFGGIPPEGSILEELCRKHGVDY